MKKLILIILATLILAAFPAAAEGEGQIILDLQPEMEEPDYGGLINEYLKELEYFDHMFPGARIEEDFVDELRSRHPDYSRKNLVWKERMIRNGVRTLRIVNSGINKLKEFLLTRKTPLIFSDDQYETGTAETYRESDRPVVITDFKKVIAYSQSERDREAMRIKNSSDGGYQEQTRVEEFKKALVSFDWEKVFSYGLFDGKSFDDNRGIGEWSGSGDLSARLLAPRMTLGDNKKLEAALQLHIADGSFLLTQDYKQYKALSVNFGGSFNVRDVTPVWPVAQRFPMTKRTGLSGYIGLVTVPLSLELQDNGTALTLRAEINGVACGNNRCRHVSARPELRLLPGAGEESRIALYLRQQQASAVKTTQPDVKITRLIAETSSNPREAPILRVEIQSSLSPKNFDIFIEDGPRPGFSAPLVRIDGKKIIARFKALHPGRKLSGQDFTVALRLRPGVELRQTLSAAEASPFDPEYNRLSPAMLGLAFLGGLLLNLMPCVFPILSLKLMSFARFGGMRGEAVRRSFAWHIAGITASFVLIIGGLLLLKYLGHSLGWGMQFQNVRFLTFMIFVVAFFLALVWGLVHFCPPSFVGQTLSKNDSDGKTLHFLTGMFMVLLSTPCTAPYLGTALGFALAGSAIDIVVVVGMVGLGLAFPYLLFVLLPGLAFYMPAPGRWMSRLNSMMALMLMLTLVWLLSVLAAQTGSGVIIRFVLFLAAFYLILWFRRVLFDIIDQLQEEAYVLHRLRRIFNLAAVLILGGLIAGAMWDANKTYGTRREQMAENSAPELITRRQLDRYLKDGRLVLVRVGADWCLTCKYNEFTVFDNPQIRELLAEYQVEVIDVDWTGYNPDVLRFMGQYGRRGLPFYIIFSPRLPEGLVLPEIISERAFRRIIEDLRY